MREEAELSRLTKEGNMLKLKFTRTTVIHLFPYSLRFNLHVHKRLGFSWKKAIKSSFKQVQNIEPKEVWLFVRRLLAHKNIKKALGTNLTFALILTSFIPSQGLAYVEAEEPTVSEAQTVLKTERATQYPVENIRITQGYRVFHPGVDLDGITGDAIKPIKNGRVQEVSYSRFAYGNAIIINHGNELTSLYAHLSEINVEPNQEVTTDTVIGKMGATGRSFGDHLHLEIRQNGRAINPTSVLPR